MYMQLDGMRPACVGTGGSVQHGLREGMLAGGPMYVDKGRWTCPDLVKLKAEKLEWRIKKVLAPGVNKSSVGTLPTAHTQHS